MKCIYVAGRLNDTAVDYLKNVSRMIKKGIEVHRSGYAVLLPCLDLLVGIVDGDYSYENYASNNMEWLKRADAVLVVEGWENSNGTRAEIGVAESLGIPVYYSLEELWQKMPP